MNKKMIYVDYAAATPVREEVFNKMKPFFSEYFGNSSSIYEFGQTSRRALDKARFQVSDALGCSPQEVFFTSGGTESNNLAIQGVVEKYKNYGKHIVTTKIEHVSILSVCEKLEQDGCRITYLEPDNEGVIQPEQVQNALQEDTILVSVIHGNNEIGTMQDIQKMGEIVSQYRRDHQRKYPVFHSDICQTIGFFNMNAQMYNLDLATINSGKIYGPKGAGALYVKKGVQLSPRMYGGGQEKKIRAGTENIPAVVGFGEAVEWVQREREQYSRHCEDLRDFCIAEIEKRVSGCQLNGHRTDRLPNNIHLSFEGIEGETLLVNLDQEGVCASTGSACTSGNIDPSHVLLAIGVSYELTHGSLRLTLGRMTTKEDVEYVVDKLVSVIQKMRSETA